MGKENTKNIHVVDYVRLLQFPLETSVDQLTKLDTLEDKLKPKIELPIKST